MKGPGMDGAIAARPLDGDSIHALFEPEVAREPRAVAHGIARKLFRGYFG